jgi:hypothetical protein
MSLDVFRHVTGMSNLTKVDRLVLVSLCPLPQIIPVGNLYGTLKCLVYWLFEYNEIAYYAKAQAENSVNKSTVPDFEIWRCFEYEELFRSIEVCILRL